MARRTVKTNECVQIWEYTIVLVRTAIKTNHSRLPDDLRGVVPGHVGDARHPVENVTDVGVGHGGAVLQQVLQLLRVRVQQVRVAHDLTQHRHTKYQHTVVLMRTN